MIPPILTEPEDPGGRVKIWEIRGVRAHSPPQPDRTLPEIIVEMPRGLERARTDSA